MEHLDVLVVGAGLSGIGAAYHLGARCPGRTYAIFEGRETLGGTWDLFRYPGIRSDSDMFTLGYAFRPWTEAKAIADGPSILKYVAETARDHAIERHIRYHHRVKAASSANRLRRRLPAKLAYQLIRWRNVLGQLYFFRVTRKRPQAAKKAIIDMVRGHLGSDYDVDTHFTPTYNPWDQRLCLVPDGDLFEAIKAGKTEVVTDHIERFTPEGVLLKSGRTLGADIIVAATGLEMQVLSGSEITVDGRRVDFAKTFSYKGMMYSEVPNLASTFGYANASWTLKADLTAEYVCRLLNHMDRRGFTECRPVNDDAQMPASPWLDFSSGYVRRAMDRFPKQGNKAPWRVHQNYALDLLAFRYGRLDDGVMRFSRPSAQTAGRAEEKFVPLRQRAG